VAEFDMPLMVGFAATRLVSDGDGALLENGNSVTLNMIAWRGDTGEEVFNTWTDEDGGPESFILGGQQFWVLSDVLIGAHVGARMLLANPTTSPEGNPVTLLSLFEVTDTARVPTRAEGVPVDPQPGLPVVTLAENGAPSVNIPADYEPSEQLISQILIRGDGPEVPPGATVTVHYTGWLLDGTQFDSSWDRGQPATFGLNQVIAGWTQGLAGQTVGSQVLLIVPPALAYGDDDRGTIPPNSTLVFVVDILGVN
jgi:peptidylprolyl isomerase